MREKIRKKNEGIKWSMSLVEFYKVIFAFPSLIFECNCCVCVCVCMCECGLVCVHACVLAQHLRVDMHIVSCSKISKISIFWCIFALHPYMFCVPLSWGTSCCIKGANQTNINCMLQFLNFACLENCFCIWMYAWMFWKWFDSIQ